ncbi:MAG: hypothetical protein HYU68_00110 [Bacteroidetes bacterium]|nr:hypothetical protein [Bacteroidota bacterium]
MKKIVFLFLVFFLLNNGYSQQFNTFFNDTLPQLNFSTQGTFDYGSNVAHNQFLNKFILGGEIKREDKDNLYSNLGNRNRAGGDFNLKVQAEIPFDTLFGKTKFSLIFGIEHVEHFDAQLSSDLVKLIFDGYKQFTGKYADIGHTNFNYLNYQQLNIGFINYKTSHGKSAKEGAVFSIIKAQEHQAITIQTGSLFTGEFGNELVFDLNYIYNSSDTANTGLKAFNGFGISTDLFTEYHLKNGGKITVNIDDLGFIQWNKKSIQIEADTVITFDGVEVDNIFDMNDSLISSFSRDSLIEYISTKKGESGYAVALPTSFNLSYIHMFSEKLRTTIGIRYRILANYFPLIYTTVQYNVSNSFITQGNLIYGGYGKFNFGITLAKQFKNNYQIILGTEHLGAYLFPASTYSNNGFLGFKMYF